jgi:hypothetical protein
VAASVDGLLDGELEPEDVAEGVDARAVDGGVVEAQHRLQAVGQRREFLERILQNSISDKTLFGQFFYKFPTKNTEVDYRGQ